MMDLEKQFTLGTRLADSLGWTLERGDNKCIMTAMFAKSTFDFATGRVYMICQDPEGAEDFAICYPHHEYDMTLTGGIVKFTIMEFVELCDALIGRFILVHPYGRHPRLIEDARRAIRAAELAEYHNVTDTAFFGEATL